jgi:hypothetical protein
MPTGGGGDAAPADSGADASVRLAGRTARTRLPYSYNYGLSSLHIFNTARVDALLPISEKI